MSLQELDSLQDTLNDALNTIRHEIRKNRLPELSTSATSPHPLDDSTFLCPPKLYKARRLALGSLFPFIVNSKDDETSFYLAGTQRSS